LCAGVFDNLGGNVAQLKLPAPGAAPGDTNDTECGHEDIGTIRRRVTLSSLAWAVGRPTGGVILVSRTTNPIFRALELAVDVVFSTASQVTAPVEHWRRLSTAIFDPYRPELHYICGPGARKARLRWLKRSLHQ
jgi:hypothetical protein